VGVLGPTIRTIHIRILKIADAEMSLFNKSFMLAHTGQHGVL